MKVCALSIYLPDRGGRRGRGAERETEMLMRGGEGGGINSRTMETLDFVSGFLPHGAAQRAFPHPDLPSEYQLQGIPLPPLSFSPPLQLTSLDG